MKKALFLCLTVLLVMTMSVTAFATGFVGSPSGGSTPSLDGFDHEDDNCQADVDILGPNDRDKMDEDERKEFDEAYDKLKDNPDISASDIFVVDFSGCSDHDDHGTTTIVLSDELMDKFDDLLQYVNGEWKAVLAEHYKVEGNKLTIQVEGTTIFAIALKGESVSPETDSLTDNGVSPVWYVLMAVSAAGLAVVAVLYARQRVKANG